jgi:hypothetical protein
VGAPPVSRRGRGRVNRAAGLRPSAPVATLRELVARPLRFAVILLALCHLGAVLLPCVRADSGGRHAAEAAVAAPGHAMPCHGDGEARVWLELRCPCGCGDRAAPPVGQARLGAALLAERVALATPPSSPLPGSPPAQLPAPPVPRIDHVPLAA